MFQCYIISELLQGTALLQFHLHSQVCISKSQKTLPSCLLLPC